MAVCIQARRNRQEFTRPAKVLFEDGAGAAARHSTHGNTHGLLRRSGFGKATPHARHRKQSDVMSGCEEPRLRSVAADVLMVCAAFLSA